MQNNFQKRLSLKKQVEPLCVLYSVTYWKARRLSFRFYRFIQICLTSPDFLQNSFKSVHNPFNNSTSRLRPVFLKARLFFFLLIESEEPMGEEEQKNLEKIIKQLEKEGVKREDFQFVLEQLLEAYRPILQEELERASSAQRLIKEAQEKPPSCEDEIALADRLFAPFAKEEVSLRLLSPQLREKLGPIDQWRWCHQHILCCLKFGWLLNRARTFRAAVYYLYRYWICIRRLFGNDPTGRPLTLDEKADFQTLSKALAGVYKPFLEGQLRNTEQADQVADDVAGGSLDCETGIAEAQLIFDRFLTPQLAPALFGKAVFEELHQHPSFWLCRCWCLCAANFGWCLAGAKNLLDVLRCLIDYFRCLLDCIRPLVCELTEPQGCVEEQEIQGTTIFRGVEIKGTATGAFCSHYILAWREAGSPTWRSDAIHYPGTPAPPQGSCGVVGGTLGYLETFPLVPAGPVEIRICVHSSQPGVSPQCCAIIFELRRNLVWIRGIEGIEAATPPGIFDPAAQLVDGSGEVRSFGTCLEIFGSAWVGGCAGTDIKRYTLSFHPGFVVNPLLPGFVQFWRVDYNTPMQIDADLNKVFERELTNRWRELKICFPPPFGCVTVGNSLQGVCWNTLAPQSFPVDFSTSPPPTWITSPLPITNCSSGKYTLRLTVEDTVGGIKYDLQQVWFDNKDIHGKISQIAGVAPCATINLSQFAVNGGDCSVPWTANIMGISYDEFIEEGNASVPSDNFGGYRLWIKKDGAPDPGEAVPVPGPVGGPFIGTTRVGDPGKRCTNAVPPPGPFPLETPGILSIFDLRRLDAVCNPAEPGLTLQRGECCTYVLKLHVWDKSICPSLSSDRHEIFHNFPIFVCNDLK